MKRLALLFVAALTACGDNNDTQCATGTKLEGNECVPDGSVICDQGTIFDTGSGQCVLDPSACAPGTVLMNDKCVEEGTFDADHEEAAEPNDGTGAGMFDAPALDQSVTIHGCVTPVGGAADQDAWIITAPTPMVLEITADGVGGLAAGFIVQDLGIAGLENYIRGGINLSGDTSKRQVYLPIAGQYILLMDDSRAILTGEAAGSEKTCYYGTIKQVALPTATAATLPKTTGTDSGNVKVFTYTPGQQGDLFDITQSTTSTILDTAFIIRKNGAFYQSLGSDAPFYTVGGLNATDTVDIIVDNVLNYSLTPQPYAFDLFDVAAQQVPMNGTSITLTKHNGQNGQAFAYLDRNYSWFDVAAGDVVRFDLTSSVSVSMLIARRDIFTPTGAADNVAALPTGTSFTGQFIRFKTAGRYYLITHDPAGVANATYTLTATRVHAQPSALTYGTASTAQALPAAGAKFHTIDLNNQNWIELGVTATDFGAANVRTTLYDLAGEGWLAGTGSVGANYPVVQTNTQVAAGTSPVGRITAGDPRDFLVRVDATAAVGTTPTYDIVVKDRPHVALGTLASGTPIVRTNTDATAAGATTRYLVTGTPGERLGAVVAPTDASVDISLARRAADESIVGAPVNSGGNGATETLSVNFGAMPSWIAYTVTNASATTATNLTSNITATPPLPYVDICATGTVLGAPFNGTADDEFSAQTLPGGFTFNFFGAAQTSYIVAANGFIAFGNTNPTCSFGCFSNGIIPAAAQPNGIIAPYWDDLADVKVCKKEEATKVTIQWTGISLESSGNAQMQVVLNANGQIDLIYGSGHTLNGVSATVGIENPAGNVGTQLSRNTAGSVAPSSSQSLTTP